MHNRFPIRSASVLAIVVALTSLPAWAAPVVERVTTIAPFPRGLAMVGDEMYVLCRGRVRSSGGVSREVDDQAGTLYAIDPKVAEPASDPVGDAVQRNGRLVARPTDPPFRLWDRASDPPEADTRTDRPYCTLRYHEPSQSLYLCAFSGVDKPNKPGDPIAFSKNYTDAMLRYDLRTGKWYEVDRHDGSTWKYPAGEPGTAMRGLLKGPDNCLTLGRWLYAVAKDNSVLVRYDLSPFVADAEAAPAPGRVLMNHEVEVEGLGPQTYYGQSALAYHDGWLYIAYRTSSVIVRVPVDEAFDVVQPIRAELVARFEPYDPVEKRSADLTDMGFDDRGRLYVVAAQPARIYRFTPDPAHVFDARPGVETPRQPWVHLAEVMGNPKMKSENVLFHDGYLYVTSGDGYDYQAGADGTVYRVAVED